jgi:hypothetical protein
MLLSPAWRSGLNGAMTISIMTAISATSCRDHPFRLYNELPISFVTPDDWLEGGGPMHGLTGMRQGRTI